MIKAVFLDIDNTLLDFDKCVQEAMREGFQKFELPPYKDYMFDAFTLINNEIWKQFERKELTFTDILHTRWQKIFDALNIAFDGYTFELYFVDYIFHSHIHEPGALKLLQYLRAKGYIICAVSNGPEKQQCNRLREAGMLEYFDYLFISERLGAVKPTAAFFDKCLAELAAGREEPLQRNEILMVGDSISSDIIGGYNSGLQTCYYNRFGTPYHGDIFIDYLINSLDALVYIL